MGTGNPHQIREANLVPKVRLSFSEQLYYFLFLTNCCRLSITLQRELLMFFILSEIR
jgi:hypothetical protein